MNRFQILLDKPIIESKRPEEALKDIVRSLMNLPDSIEIELKIVPMNHVKIPGENDLSYTPNFTKTSYVYRDGVIKQSGVAEFYLLKKQTLYAMRDALKAHPVTITKIILLFLDDAEEKMVGLWIPQNEQI